MSNLRRQKAARYNSQIRLHLNPGAVMAENNRQAKAGPALHVLNFTSSQAKACQGSTTVVYQRQKAHHKSKGGCTSCKMRRIKVIKYENTLDKNIVGKYADGYA